MGPQSWEGGLQNRTQKWDPKMGGDSEMGPQNGTPKCGQLQNGTPKWDSRMGGGPQNGTPNWGGDPEMGEGDSKMGPQNGGETPKWDPKIGLQNGTPNLGVGTPKWDPKMTPDPIP